MNTPQRCLVLEDVECSPEICPLQNGPAICFEPGEQLPGVDFKDREPVTTIKPIQKEEEREMEKEPKQKRKYQRRAKSEAPVAMPGKAVATPLDAPVIETLIGKLHEHNKAAWAIMGALATLRELGVKVDMPVMEWPK